jgi:hypothetical protein
LDIYLKECKTIPKRDTCTPLFIAALFTIAKLWNQLRCPTTDEWIKKYTHAHVHAHACHGILFSYKEK